jgi:Tfp pilus assembly protein PilO
MAFLDEYSEKLNEQPLHVKAGFLLLIMAVISLVYWYFFWSHRHEELQIAENKLRQHERKIRE